MNSIKSKDRLPEETIAILKKFFNERNFSIEIEELSSEIGSYSCEIRLKFKNIFLMHSNGKGTTPEYSLASGLAELYERFCNRENIGYAPYFMTNIMKSNYKKYNYYMDPEEKVGIPFTEAMKIPPVKKIINLLSNNMEDYKEWIYNNFIGERYVGLPYKNINDEKDILYIDKKLLFASVGSNGMAAGNSFKEAFCQAMSELCERAVYQNFYNSISEPIYALNIDKLNLSTEILEMMNKLPFNFYLLDLSNYIKAPVVGLVIIDKERLFSRMDIGSFPNANIAIERTFTEMYQNIFSFNECYDIKFIPSFAKTYEDLMFENPHTIINSSYLPKNFFNRIQYVDNFDNDYYTNEVNTESIYNFYLKLIKNNNWSIYYNDCSLSKEMTALQLYSPNLFTSWLHIRHFYLSDNIKNDINELINMTKEIRDMMEKNDIYNDKFLFLINESNIELCNFRFDLLTNFAGGNLLLPLCQGNEIGHKWLDLLINSIKNSNLIEYTVDCEPALKLFIGYPILKKYLALMQYKVNNKTFKEAYNDLTPYGITVIQEDYNKCMNLEFLMFKTYYEPIARFYNSEDYQMIIDGFTRKD